MNFENIILSASDLKEAKLLTHALKASKEPDTGVTINVKSAYNVIKDCATIASKYLVIHAYINIPEPLETLKGLFNKSAVRDFIERSKNECHTQLLLRIILEDIKNHHNHNTIHSLTTINDNNSISNDDVYGDYDSITEVKTSTHSTSVEKILFEVFRVV